MHWYISGQHCTGQISYPLVKKFADGDDNDDDHYNNIYFNGKAEK